MRHCRVETAAAGSFCKLNVDKLRRAYRERGLVTEGLKQTLIKRLEEHDAEFLQLQDQPQLGRNVLSKNRKDTLKAVARASRVAAAATKHHK